MDDRLLHLPADLREAAAKLPHDDQHTVLDLPPPGEGHNAGLIKVASICFRMGVTAENTLIHLREIYDSDRMDYDTAPRRAVERVWEHKGDVPHDGEDEVIANATPREDFLLRFSRTPSIDLMELSPGNVKTHPKDIIRGLFDATDIINIQRTGREAGTLVKVSELPEKIAPFKFLNPSVFKKIEGITVEHENGKPKVMTRCNDNVLKRLYMLLEFDYNAGDENGPALVERFTTLMMIFAKFIPLTMVVDTGNKSLHFWFDARNAPPKVVSLIFAIARLHGCDKQMAVKSQIARMPNVSAAADGRDAQRVLYYDPDGINYPDNGEKGAWDHKGIEDHLLNFKHLNYYYAGKNEYYMLTQSNIWMPINRHSLSNQLALQNVRNTKLDTEVLSPADTVIANLETERSVEAVLNGASGKHAGFYQENGSAILVRKSPTPIKPRKGDWSTIAGYLKHKFRADDIQFEIILGHLSAAVRDFRNGGRRQSRFAPRQFLILAGEKDSGKSFFTTFILPALFGNRWAKLDPYFDPKGSDFNSEMHQAEVLILDETSVIGSSYAAKYDMTERVKNLAVGSGEGYHSKGVDRISIRPWWYPIRLMNTNPEQLATLPLMEEGAADKWILLFAKCLDGGMVDKSNPNWFEPWRDQIVAEIPAFLHYLLNEHVIGPDAKDPSGRYAVQSYKNPELLESLLEDSPETHLLHRIDTDASEAMFAQGFGDNNVTAWRGTAGALYDILTECGSVSSQRRFAKTCPSPRVLSSQLKMLEKSHPTRATYSNRDGMTPKKLEGNYYWLIEPKDGDVSASDCF